MLLKVLLAVAAVGSCRARPPEHVSVSLDELTEGRRALVLVGDDPVEVVESETGIVARSLLCTHMGCQVKWQPEHDEYRCPCHEGRYNADGEVIEGMPTGPLREVPFELREGEAVFSVEG